MDQLPFWQRLIAHPAYDRYWSEQAVDKILAARPLTVPTLYVHSQWDQEDIYGAVAAFTATRSQSGAGHDNSHLGIGPWRHGGGNGDGSSLGAIKFDGDTGGRFRLDVLLPFFDSHLKDNAPQAAIATVTGVEPAANSVRLDGQRAAHIVPATGGTDGEWGVNLIDVYPEGAPGNVERGGYQWRVALDVMRGRCRDERGNPSAIPAGKIIGYTLKLPNADHVFLPGHRIMVQIQSSWFPLYDRNPQTFVPNIFFAKPADYMKATQRVFHKPGAAS